MINLFHLLSHHVGNQLNDKLASKTRDFYIEMLPFMVVSCKDMY